MKLLLVIIYEKINQEWQIVNKATDFSSFNYFARKSMEQNLLELIRVTLPIVTPKHICYTDHYPFKCCFDVRENRAIVLICDLEYPIFVAFTFLNQELLQPSINLEKEFEKYQNPEAFDKLIQIQKNLDDIKDIMHENIEKVLERGENIATTLEKAEELKHAADKFIITAKKANRCCKF
jgi:Synaptobrevin/Ribosomal protein L17